MGFLFYGDVLGIAALLDRSHQTADNALTTIRNEAWAVSHQTFPDSIKPIGSKEARLACYNDSVFFYAPDFLAVAWFAAELARRLFLTHEDNGGPLAIRGAIMQTEAAPRIFSTEELDGQARFSRITLKGMGHAMIADKQKLSGARIIFRPEILEVSAFPNWRYEAQAMVMDLAKFPERIESDTLQAKGKLSGYVDLAWMNSSSNVVYKRIEEAAARMHWYAAFNQSAAIHAAATTAMLRLTEFRRRGIGVIIRRLHAGVQKARGQPLKKHARDDYQAWFKEGAMLQKSMGKPLLLPIDMTDTKIPRR